MCLLSSDKIYVFYCLLIIVHGSNFFDGTWHTITTCKLNCDHNLKIDSDQFDYCNHSCQIGQCKEGCGLYHHAVESYPCSVICTHWIYQNISEAEQDSSITKTRTQSCIQGCSFGLDQYYHDIVPFGLQLPGPSVVKESITHNSVELEWESERDFENFAHIPVILQKRVVDTNTEWQIHNETERTYTGSLNVTDLDPYMTYEFRLMFTITTEHFLETESSAAVTTLPFGAPSSAPTITSLLAPSSTVISVSWRPPFYINMPLVNYHLSLHPVDTDDAHVIDTDVSPDVTSWIFGQLLAGRTYEVRVAAVNVEGEGPEHTKTITMPMPEHYKFEGLSVEKVPDCEEYDDGSLCTSQSYYFWACENFRSYSNLHSCFTKKNTLEGLCVDKVPNCEEYDDGSLCTSQSYYSWAYENCRSYCKFDVCNDTCVDQENFDCAAVDLALNLCADKHKAKNVCRKYCNLCDMVDGSWAHWASWSECSASCGNGTRNRTRNCTDPAPKNGGLYCMGTASELQPCEGPACPVHGNWGSWSAWGLCSVSCDVGMQRRDRACDSPYPSRQGDHCFGTALEYRVCLPGACADGEWSEWGEWSNCSSGCGGVRERERNCSNPEPSAVGRQCLGNNLDTEKCSCGVPSFTATNLTSGRTSGTVTFSSVLFSEGNDYNVTSGVFTCSVPGLYHFTASLTKKNSSSVYYAHCYLRLNGATKVYINIYPRDSSNNGYGSYSASATVVWRLDVGDTVDLGNCTSASYFNGATSVFTGFLVKSDL